MVCNSNQILHLCLHAESLQTDKEKILAFLFGHLKAFRLGKVLAFLRIIPILLFCHHSRWNFKLQLPWLCLLIDNIKDYKSTWISPQPQFQLNDIFFGIMNLFLCSSVPMRSPKCSDEIATKFWMTFCDPVPPLSCNNSWGFSCSCISQLGLIAL